MTAGVPLDLDNLRDAFMAAEDQLAAVFPGSDARIPLYEFIDARGRVYSDVKYSTISGVRHRVRSPVAYVGYDGACLYVVHEGKRIDVLDEDRVYVLHQVAHSLPQLHARLVADAAVRPEDMRAAATQLRQWLDQLGGQL